MTTHEAGPLDGIRVLDLTRVLAGPYCTMFLGDMGAEIVKIEQPVGGDDTRNWGPPFAGGESAYFLCVNRNKKSLAVDLRSAAGVRLLHRLAAKADVLVENFRPGTMESWGVGYDALCKINPELVYASLSAFGSRGPMSSWPGYDLVVQAWGGLMSITSAPDGEPMKVGVAIIDIVAGLMLGKSIAAALYARAGNGKGQRIETSLLEAEVACLINAGSNYLVSGEVPGRWGNAHPNIVPYQNFATADGYLVVGVANEAIWQRFCHALERPEGLADPRFTMNADRVEHRKDLIPMLEEVFLTRTRGEWARVLIDAGIPCSPVQTIDEVFSAPQVAATEMLQEVEHPTAGSLRLAAPPVKFSRTPATIRLAPPLLGQHTEEVLKQWLGLSPGEMAEFKTQGAFG